MDTWEESNQLRQIKESLNQSQQENILLKRKLDILSKSLKGIQQKYESLEASHTQNNIRQSVEGDNAKMFGQVGRDVNIGGDDNKVSVLNMSMQTIGLVLLGTVMVSFIFSQFLGPYLNTISFFSLSTGQWGAGGALVGFIVTLVLVLRGKLPNFFNGQNFTPLLVGAIAGSILVNSYFGPFLESNLNIASLTISWNIWGAIAGLMVALSIIKPGSVLSYNIKSAIPIAFWIIVSVILSVTLIGPYLDSSPLAELFDSPIPWSVVGIFFGLLIPFIQKIKVKLPFSPKLISILFVSIISALYFSSTIGPVLETISWFPEIKMPFSWKRLGFVIGGIVAWRVIPKF